jgi:hypothetical protein
VVGRAACVVLGFVPGESCGRLRTARSCEHPDAQWLAGLFPPGTKVTRGGMEAVMLEQGDDPRAMFLAWRLAGGGWTTLIKAAVEAGYAPAQALLSEETDREPFLWASRAAAQGNRVGIYRMGVILSEAPSGTEDRARAIELFREAAELGEPRAQYRVGLTFGELDWQRYFWWERAAARGNYGYAFCEGIVKLLPSFGKGLHGRILHTVAPLIRRNCDFANQPLCSNPDIVQKAQQVVELHDAMLTRAREALLWWGIVGRRLGVVRDIRVMIGKLSWAEVWQWGEQREQGVVEWIGDAVASLWGRFV